MSRVSEYTFDPLRDPSVSQHVVLGETVMPGAVLIGAVLAAGTVNRTAAETLQLSNVTFHSPFVFPDAAMRKLTVEVDEGLAVACSAFSSEGERVRHANGTIKQLAPENLGRLEPEAIAFRCGKAVRAEDYYRLFEEAGIRYGRFYRNIKEIRFNKREAIARIELGDTAGAIPGNPVLHPALLDGAIQSLGIFSLNENSPYLHVPYYVESIKINQMEAGEYYCLARVNDDRSKQSSTLIKYDLFICGRNGKIGAELINFCLKRVKLPDKAGV